MENDELQEVIKGKDGVIGVLRAKYYLDVLDYKVHIVAEYPDLVEENNQLYDTVD